MAIPTVRSIGAKSAGVTSGTIALPTYVAGDVLLLVTESGGLSTVSQGYVHVTTTATLTSTFLNVMWKRAAQVETAPTVTATNHFCGGIMSLANVTPSGNPFDVYSTSTEAVSDTSANPPTVTTTKADDLVIFISGVELDSESAPGSSVTAPSLSSPTLTTLNYGTSQGGGGGIAVGTGGLATAGTTGTLTITLGVAAATKTLWTGAVTSADIVDRTSARITRPFPPP